MHWPALPSSTNQQSCRECGEEGHNKMTCTNTFKIKRSKKSMAMPKIDSFPTCAVCLEQIKDTKNSMCLPCGHNFHVTCGLQWLQENNTCPCCRAECGEKVKKVPKLNPMVSTTLSQHQLDSINFAGFIEMQMQTMESPWLHPRFLHEMQEAVSRGLHGINSEHANKIKEIMECSNCSNIAANNMLNQLDAKDIWNAFSESDRKSRMRDYLLQHQAVLLGQSFMDLLHSVWHYQEDEELHGATTQFTENETVPQEQQAEDSSMSDEQFHWLHPAVLRGEVEESNVPLVESVPAINTLDERTIDSSGNVVNANNVDVSIAEINNILEEMDDAEIFEGLTDIIRENITTPNQPSSNRQNAPSRHISHSRVFDENNNVLEHESMSNTVRRGIDIANNVTSRSSARIAAQRQSSGVSRRVDS